MKELTIVKGEEFRVVVKNGIKSEDIFIEEYKEAARKLNDVVLAARKVTARSSKDFSAFGRGFQEDMIDCYENNIIAFCGERGEGKSSAMMTFINEVQNNRSNSVLPFAEEVALTYFAPPIIIDPSLFDGVHNVLDIVLAKLFQRFRKDLDNEQPCLDIGKREKLVQRFQNVYRCVSLINDEKKMLDDEYDYEGNISKLKKLGASTNLKNELKDLIDEYLEFMRRCEKKESRYTCNQLMIAIDDLDLCSKNAYKMAEQLRKYMILPNVTIIMAIKLDQLELCIEEANRMDFSQILKTRNREKNADNLDGEFFQMSERYVAKLIPKSRRLYLPKASSFKEIRVLVREVKEDKIAWDSGMESDMTAAILKMIYGKTGMMFLKGGDNENALIPNNLREMLNFISLLAAMPVPENKEDMLRNILTFKNYIENSWLENNFLPSQVVSAKEMMDSSRRYLNINVRRQLDEIFRPSLGNPFPYRNPSPFGYFFSEDDDDAYASIINYIDSSGQKANNKREEKWIYFFRLLYTVRLNTLLNQENYDGFLDFIQGYIWGKGFSGVLPRVQTFNIDRSRFLLRPDIGLNVVIVNLNKYLKDPLEPIEILDKPGHYRVYNIEQNEKKWFYLIPWIILGIFSNLVEPNNDGDFLLYKTSSIISNSRSVARNIQVSLENYFVSLCNLSSVYDKVNLAILGYSRDQFDRLIAMFEESNYKSIACAREIAANVDLTIALREYCRLKRNFKEVTSSSLDRSVKVVDKFLGNVAEFMAKQGFDIEPDDLRYLKCITPNGIGLNLSVSELYAEFIEACIKDIQTRKIEQKRQQIQAFKSKISNDLKVVSIKDQRLPQYFLNRNAQRVKEILDKNAEVLNAVRVNSKDSPEAFSIDDWCELYEDVVETCQFEANAEISEEIAKRYRELAAKLKYGENK